MAKRKAAKKPAAGVTKTDQKVEPMVIALAEQLGSFLGRLQKKADGWRGNATMRQQATQIRDGAADLLKQVSKAGASAGNSVASRAPKKAKTKAKAKRRSSVAQDAPSRRLRKPPPQELFDPRLGEPMGKQMGQKNLKRRAGRG